MKKSETIDKLNDWIKICDRHALMSLRNNINNYKNLTFNYLVALVSFPTSKLFRFECDIVEMVWEACSSFKYSIFPRVNNLSKEELDKYNQRSLPIPIALFVADTSRNDKQRSKK
jgi:hypothetical protein